MDGCSSASSALGLPSRPTSRRVNTGDGGAQGSTAKLSRSRSPEREHLAGQGSRPTSMSSRPLVSRRWAPRHIRCQDSAALPPCARHGPLEASEGVGRQGTVLANRRGASGHSRHRDRGRHAARETADPCSRGRPLPPPTPPTSAPARSGSTAIRGHPTSARRTGGPESAPALGRQTLLQRPALAVACGPARNAPRSASSTASGTARDGCRIDLRCHTARGQHVMQVAQQAKSGHVGAACTPPPVARIARPRRRSTSPSTARRR